MPTKLEDIETPLCDSNIMGKFSNPELIYVNIEFARKLERELHVAREELKPCNGHTFESLQTMWENTHIELARVNSELAQANQKCQLVDEVVASLNRARTFIPDGYSAAKSIDITLSKAAKTL